MIIWGDSTSGRDDSVGAAYDPVTDEWRVLASSPLGPRSGHLVGSQLAFLVFGAGLGLQALLPLRGDVQKKVDWVTRRGRDSGDGRGSALV